MFLDPIQKRAPAKSVQLKAVYLEALLYRDYLREDVITKKYSSPHVGF